MDFSRATQVHSSRSSRLLCLASTKIKSSLVLRALSLLDLNDVTIHILGRYTTLGSLMKPLGGESYQNQLLQFNSPKGLVKSGLLRGQNHTIPHWQLYSNGLLYRTEAEFPRRMEQKLRQPSTGHFSGYIPKKSTISRLYQFGVDVARLPCLQTSVWFVLH